MNVYSEKNVAKRSHKYYQTQQQRGLPLYMFNKFHSDCRARFLMYIIVVICQFYIHIALDESFNFEWRNHHKFDNIANNYIYT